MVGSAASWNCAPASGVEGPLHPVPKGRPLSDSLLRTLGAGHRKLKQKETTHDKNFPDYLPGAARRESVGAIYLSIPDPTA